MDKKTILVVVACVAALMLWQKLVNVMYPPTPLPEPSPAAQGTNQTDTVTTAEAPWTGDETPPATRPETPVGEPAPAAELPTPREPEQVVVLENEKLRIALTTHGGGIQAVELLEHDNNGSGNVVLNSVDGVPALALADFPDAGPDSVYQVERPDRSTVRFRRQTADGTRVIKEITLGGGYQLAGQVQVVSGVGAAEPAHELKIVIGTATPVTTREPPDLLGTSWLIGSKFHSRRVKHARKNADKGIPSEPAEGARWAAVNNQFFALLLNPSTNITAVGMNVQPLPPPPGWKGKQPPEGLTAWAAVPAVLQGDGRLSYPFTYYAGPKEYRRLVALGDGEEEVMHFGFWGVISVVLLRSMNFFHSLIPNYGVAIILITIVIKIIFWPIQSKSTRSMRQMQKFQPMMTKLREKYKDDPQRMNQEMMKLYKEHKINPFAGCLPMLVQIPVFFAFYTMLRSAVELRGASFLWIKDLSQPDTIAHLGGFALNPLPLAMGVSMIGQMKLTPSGGDPKQQQMMMIMPVVFLFICYNMSSGLVLYWTVQQLLSMAQQWYTLKHAAQEEAAAELVSGPLPPGAKPARKSKKSK